MSQNRDIQTYEHINLKLYIVLITSVYGVAHILEIGIGKEVIVLATSPPNPMDHKWLQQDKCLIIPYYIHPHPRSHNKSFRLKFF